MAVTDRRKQRVSTQPPATFDIDVLPPSAHLTVAETSAVLRRSPGALALWRRNPKHPLRWRIVDGRPLYRVDAVREYVALKEVGKK